MDADQAERFIKSVEKIGAVAEKLARAVEKFEKLYESVGGAEGVKKIVDLASVFAPKKK